MVWLFGSVDDGFPWVLSVGIVFVGRSDNDGFVLIVFIADMVMSYVDDESAAVCAVGIRSGYNGELDIAPFVWVVPVAGIDGPPPGTSVSIVTMVGISISLNIEKKTHN